MRVIGAGFGRTGTSSLKVALEELGFGPCYHFSEILAHPSHLDAWEAAVRGEQVDWHKLFEGYQAVLDWPASAYYEQLWAAFPSAKILLTVRDPDKWYESTRRTAYRATKMALSPRILVLFLDAIAPVQQRAVRLVEAVAWQGVFDGRFADKQQALTVFEQHLQKVKDSVPASNLLVYNVSQGWEPLCAFLGVDVPKDTPFPHLFDTAAFENQIKERTRFAAVRLGAAATPLVLLMALGVWFWRRRLARLR